MRYNSEGLPREKLLWALSKEKIVMQARGIDSCLLCRRRRVNEAGLCEVCWTLLSDDELKLALRWTGGVAP